MKLRAWIGTAFLAGLLSPALVQAQHSDASKPRLSPPGAPRSQPKAQQVAQPSDSARPPGPAPSQSPQEACVAGGGDWIDGQCSMERTICENFGKKWNPQLRRCETPKPTCPEGTQLQHDECVPLPPPPPPVQPVAPRCAPGSSWDGQWCIPNCGPGTHFDYGLASCVTNAPIPRSTAQPDRDKKGSEALKVVTLSLGGVGLVTGFITGSLALAFKGKLEQSCEDKSCYPSAKSDYNTASTMAAVATVSTLGGVALLVVGLALPSGSSAKSSAVAPRWSVAGDAHAWRRAGARRTEILAASSPLDRLSKRRSPEATHPGWRAASARRSPGISAGDPIHVSYS